MRIEKGIWVTVFFIALIVIFFDSPYANTPYVGLYGDTLGGSGGLEHSMCNIFCVPPLGSVEMWVWFKPNCAKGMSAAEFKILYPSATYIEQGVVTSNLLNQSETGTLADGISVSLGNNCQYDWYWTHHQELVVKNPAVWPIAIRGNPTNGGHLYVGSCEGGSPQYDAMILNDLYINSGRDCYCQPHPALCDVRVRSSTVVRAYFDFCAVSFNFPIDKQFVLWDKSDPLDSIYTVEVEDVAWTGTEYELTFERPMVDSTTYVLLARKMAPCDCWYYYDCSFSPSTSEFTYRTIATLLQSSSAALVESGIEVTWELSEIDKGIDFFVSRCEDGAEFGILGDVVLAREGLRFRYVDRSVEPGKKYCYKVEYGIGKPSKLLFISEAISTPAMPLTLYPNRPNPFNPSTTISFYLPEQCGVRLEVYDISGGLVDRLIRGERRGPGTYSVDWNGRDSQGRPVSPGIYFYRLTAGKKTISRKMVLLR